ncbi:hypothetical protein [Bifidobacterium sp.]|uniref:hypothetical protein n=1 Tax=Bifidobacterium sp. TaxID=41200 RepID=UPI0039E9D29F
MTENIKTCRIGAIAKEPRPKEKITKLILNVKRLHFAVVSPKDFYAHNFLSKMTKYKGKLIHEYHRLTIWTLIRVSFLRNFASAVIQEERKRAPPVLRHLISRHHTLE